MKKTSKAKFPKGKLMLVYSIIISYAAIALILSGLVSAGIIKKMPVEKDAINIGDSVIEQKKSVYESMPLNLQIAQQYLQQHMIEENGHINLYLPENKSLSHLSEFSDYNTNSEAASYYLQWTAQAKDKEKFDRELRFIESYMLEQNFGYMKWRLNNNETAVDDGGNIATDADLRAIKALMIAQDQWPDSKYPMMIDKLADGIEKVAITSDGYLAPYGGSSGKDSWTADEVWLSYTDFTVLEYLAKTKGYPWNKVYDKMKQATLNAQLENGLYNSGLTTSRQYANGLDDGGYSINSMWIMVRNAESGDLELMQSANKSLDFYKKKFEIDAALYAKYDSSGNALSPSDTPWVYALVGRTAIALNDTDFSDQMMRKLMEKQVIDPSSQLFGSFPEYRGQQRIVGQFTMQESIITMQEYLAKRQSMP